MRSTKTAALALSLLLASAGSVHAQAAIGVKGGVNFSGLSGDDAEGADRRTGGTAGIFLVLGHSGFVAIQPELLWAQMGAQGDDEETGFDIDLKTTYLQIPVLARVNFAGMPGGVRPFFLIGPALGVNLDCKYEIGSFTSDNCEDDNGDSFVKNIDFAGVFGAGVGFGAGPAEFTVEGRLYQGLTNVLDTEEAFGDDLDVKNDAWQVLAGIAIPLGRRY